MNILLIIPETSGTIAKVSHNLYQSLKKQTNANIYVACLDGTKKGFDFGNVYVWNSNKRYPLVGLISKIRFLKIIKTSLKIDISISTHTNCNILNVLSKTHETTIGIFHSPIEQVKVFGNFKYYIMRFLYRIFVNKLSFVYGVSTTVCDDLKKYAHVNAEVLYNIHDIENINEFAKECISLEEESIFKKKSIIYVGKLYNIKAPERLIESFNIYNTKYNNECNLVFIGEESFNYMTTLISLISKYNLSDHVYFLGKKENPYKYIKRSKLLVSPSISEGLPGVIIEALVLGIPVVATNSSKGVWEIMQCENKYNENLKELEYTKYGIITPNVIGNEQFNINKLEEGINYVLKNKYNQIESFDIQRFSGKCIIEKLLTIK